MVYEVDLEVWKEEGIAIVKTDLGEVFLRLESKSYSLRRRIMVYDHFRVLIGRIEKKVFRARKHYNIYFEDEKLAVLKKGRFLMWKKYRLKSIKGTTYSISGDIKNYKFQILNNRKIVADISQSSQGAFGRIMITINDEQNTYLLLCTVITLTRPWIKKLKGE